MKNEFDMLNDIKNNIDSIEEISLSNEDKKNISSRVMKKIKNKNKVSKKALVAAALSIILTGSFMLTNEKVLAQMNGIGKKIESFFGKEDDLVKEYKKDILQSSEDKGIKFMLHEVMLDDEELYISASMDYKNFDKSTLSTNYKGDLKIVPSRENPKFEILLNGNKVDVTGMGGSYNYNEDGTVDMLLKLDMNNNDLGEIYDIKINIDTMETQPNYKKNEYIKGNWNLDFKVDGNEILKEIKVIDINKKIEIENKGEAVSILVEELRISPFSMRLKYKTNSLSEIGFKFTDENGKEIEFISQGGSNEGLSYKYIIERDFEKIKITPTISDYGIISTKTTEFENKTIELQIK